MFSRKNFLICSIAAAACLSSVVASSAESTDKAPGSGPSPYTDCGIGAALFPNTGWAAVTSNVIWDLGVTALTSATMSPQTCSGKKQTAALFIERNYDVLAEQMARGKGEYLSQALTIFECKRSAHQGAIGAARKTMTVKVSAPGYATRAHLDKATDMYFAIEGAVSSSCTA